MTIALHELRVAAPDNPAVELLKGIDLTIKEGTVTLVIGHTGSGKSTLLQVLSGILAPSSGKIFLNEQPIWEKGKVNQTHLLRLGMTFQFPEQQLFAGSVHREFSYSLRPYKLDAGERERRIREASQDFDPHGVFAMDRSPFSLSGGEQRRLALATSFATEPDWLIMDEPTAGLEAAAVRELLRLIREKRPRGGFVIATHDLDTFFPLADRVLVMDQGVIVADSTPDALCRAPEVLQRAGVGLPSSVLVAQALARAGVDLAPDRLTPSLAAEAIAAALKTSAASSRGTLEKQREAKPSLAIIEPPEAETPPPQQAAWLRLDPRAKWLLYLLLVIGTMLQQQWMGLALAALPVALAFIGIPRTVLQGGWRIVRSFILFMAISVSLAGIELTSASSSSMALGFSSERAWLTLLNVTRLLIVIVAGYWLAATTPYGQLVQGLNWALHYFKKVKLPVDSFALAVSLIFRFIPLIMREWQRFSAIVRARGKVALRPGAVRARDIPALVVPLLLSMFHKAEQMAIAMEMKKVDGKSLSHESDRMQWRRADTMLVAGGLLSFGFLVYVRTGLLG